MVIRQFNKKQLDTYVGTMMNYLNIISKRSLIEIEPVRFYEPHFDEDPIVKAERNHESDLEQDNGEVKISFGD